MHNLKQDKVHKFVTGQSRYCQGCGKESHELFEVTHNVKKIGKLHYCAECKSQYKVKAV